MTSIQGTIASHLSPHHVKRFEKHRCLFRHVYLTGLITAEGDGYFDELLASMIEVPVEIRNRRTEVIFLVVDGVTESLNEDPDGMDLTADQFFGALPDCRHRSRQRNDSGDQQCCKVRTCLGASC